MGKGISVTGKTLPHAKVVVTLPNGSKRTGTADAKGIFRIPVGLVNAADNLEIFVTGQNTKSKSYTKSKSGDVPRTGLTQEEKENAFLRGAQDMAPQTLIDNLPKGWRAKATVSPSDGKTRILIRDGNGIIRIRIDTPDKRKSKRSTDYYHKHKYNAEKESLNAENKVVNFRSKAAHIMYDWGKYLAKVVIPSAKRW